MPHGVLLVLGCPGIISPQPAAGLGCHPWAGWRGTGGGKGIRALACVELTGSMWAARAPSCSPFFMGEGSPGCLPLLQPLFAARPQL